MILGALQGKRTKEKFLDSTIITIIGVGFVFLMTTLGSAVVFLFKKNVGDKINSLLLGFASGLMIAASIWSLILPSIEGAESLGKWSFVPATVGIIFGALFLILLDKLVQFIIKRKGKNGNGLTKPIKLFIAVTLHNIPEGLAVGLAFGNAIVASQISAFYSALWLAIGIGIQNFPEGAALALPIKDEYNSKKKGFLFGVASGAVEPVMAVIGIFLSSALSSIMSWLLAFSAGAMLFVVAEELLPEAKFKSGSSVSTLGFILGFVLMMILDVALG